MNPRTRRAALYAIGAIAILASANALTHSYAGLYDWAWHHRLTGWQAMSWPAEIDVFLAIGELALYVAYLDGWAARQRIWPWATALIGLAVSVAGNIGHIQPEPGHPVILADRLTAATSPVAAFAGLAIGLLVLKMTRAEVVRARVTQASAAQTGAAQTGAAQTGAAQDPAPADAPREPEPPAEPAATAPDPGQPGRSGSGAPRAAEPAPARARPARPAAPATRPGRAVPSPVSDRAGPEHARQAYRASLAAESPLSARALAARHDISRRQAGKIVAEVDAARPALSLVREKP